MTDRTHFCILPVIMKFSYKTIELLNATAPVLQGVLTLADLSTLFPVTHKTELYRLLASFEQEGLLRQFVKGIYVTREFNPAVLSQRLCPESYVSLSSILAQHMVVGIAPTGVLDAVKCGRSRTYRGAGLTIKHFSLTPAMFFGFETKAGLHKATAEKALLDTLYFHQHGTKFPFDIYSDLNWEHLNFDLISAYLKRYYNPKFVKFVEGLMHAVT